MRPRRGNASSLDATPNVLNRACVYLSTQEELEEFCEAASRARVLAVDTEFLREKTYYPKLCLIQVSTGERIAAVDPILINDLAPLKALLENKDIVKVFHACSQDLEVLYDGMGCVCRNVFDTQVAAAFLGLRQQIGYGQLVETYCDVHLPKAEALTDWSQRPLDPEQLAYAEDDVRYLPGIYESMTKSLVEKDRLGWVLPEMEAISDPSRFVRDPSESFLRLKRVSSLTRRQLAVAREVCLWREKAASSRNVPRRWLMSDEAVIELCRRTPTSLPRLRRIRGLEQVSEADARAIVDAVSRGLSCEPERYPDAIKRPHAGGEDDGAVELMGALLRVIAGKEGIAPQVIANKDDLIAFLAGDEGCSLAHGWRLEVAGKPLKKLLAGELGLTIKDGSIEIL